MSCNVHTGVRIAPISLVQEDLRLRHIKYGHMKDGEKRHTLEMQLREEEEYLKLQMYLRDERFAHSLQTDPQFHNKFYKTIIDVLHMPMRTNEKVLTLLYEEVTQGAHKAQVTSVLSNLTPIVRRLGELGEHWTHQFEEKNSKAIKKFKLPYDQSRKIFAINQLSGLREAVEVAIPASNQELRDCWLSFLYEYVHMNAFLHSTDDYSSADMDVLEQHIDKCYNLLVTRIGGAERGVTNYFHYIGAGHLMWMIRRYGNLWRFCQEGAESLNALVSKRYNLFNNKGGNKKTHEGGPKQKCLPFECLGSWLGRLSLWHTGIAVDFLHEEAWEHTNWMDPHTTIEWCEDMDRYIVKHEADTVCNSDSDSDWSEEDMTGDCIYVDDECIADVTSDDDESCSDNAQEDDTWLYTAPVESTWMVTQDGVKSSLRSRFQQRPIQPMLHVEEYNQ